LNTACQTALLIIHCYYVIFYITDKILTYIISMCLLCYYNNQDKVIGKFVMQSKWRGKNTNKENSHL